jgi:hypothetical protein
VRADWGEERKERTFDFSQRVPDLQASERASSNAPEKAVSSLWVKGWVFFPPPLKVEIVVGWTACIAKVLMCGCEEDVVSGGLRDGRKAGRDWLRKVKMQQKRRKRARLRANC